MALDADTSNGWEALLQNTLGTAATTGAQILRDKYASPVGPQPSYADVYPSVTPVGSPGATPIAAPQPITKRAWFIPAVIGGVVLLAVGAFFLFRGSSKRKR